MEASRSDLERVFASRSSGFARALFAVTGDEEAAADAVQDAFASALASLSSFRGGSLEAWVWRIAVRSAGRAARRPLLAASTSHLDDVLAVSRQIDPELRRAVGRLPPQRRLVVFLRFWAGLSYAEIAELRGISVGTVSATLSQALEQLRGVVDQEVPS